MKKWKSFYTYLGDGETWCITHEFDIPDSLYDELMENANKGIAISTLDCYKELEQLAENSFHLEDYDEDLIKPERSDYDSDEDYESDLEDYNDSVESLTNFWWNLDGWGIYDPSFRVNFMNHFIGKKLPEIDGDGSFQFDSGTGWDDLELTEKYDDSTNDYSFTIEYKNGHIVDITDIRCEVLEWEGATYSGHADVEPDYDVIADRINERFFPEDYDY